MGLAAVAAHRLAGFIPVGAIFKASLKVGQLNARGKSEQPQAVPALRVLP
jgi:hypothetical protein